TFFLDKFRFPLLLSIILISTITAKVPEGDSYYRSERTGAWDRPLAADVVRQQKNHQLLLVSAPGGGIQSAAFTTYVLDKLNAETGGEFIKRTAAITSVSGGSVGVFHLAASEFDTKRALDTSLRSSIDHVAWGWVVPDLARALFPWVGNRT